MASGSIVTDWQVYEGVSRIKWDYKDNENRRKYGGIFVY